MIALAEWIVAVLIVGFTAYSFLLFLASEWAKGRAENRKRRAERLARKMAGH